MTFSQLETLDLLDGLGPPLRGVVDPAVSCHPYFGHHAKLGGYVYTLFYNNMRIKMGPPRHATFIGERDHPLIN